ncbi:hypothetical protein BC937DRAFT_95419 [Endogone sp. FLAS-F59071]|nr:hypothetical protein BC937DRAFT_95419 [Endogone sp. FLAS-F59071]|eukprot:RUS20347.1 hypothetical protein BC937DRAFT_95419 [Endogone sp. FLAS-F59071]
MQAQSHGTLEDSFIQDVAETMTSRSNDVKSEELSSNQDYSPSPLDEVEEHGELSQQSQWILKSTGQNVKTIVDYYVSKHTELSADIACHYIVDLTVQRHPKSIRNEFSEEEWSEMLGMQNESPLRLPTACEEMITKFKACNFLTQIDKLDNDFLEGSFSSIEQRRSSDGSHLRYIEFVHKKFFDCWKHDPNRLRNQSQGTFVSRLISSVVEELFVNDVKIVSPNWGELGSVESSIQRIGQQTDIIFNMSDANKTECGFCEVSGPMDQEDATKVRDDREKLAKEMKDALDLVLKRASSAPLERLRKLKIWGIQIEGWTWRLYSISLCYDGLYRFEQLNYCAVPKHPDEWVLISTFCRHLIHFREIILATCKQIEDVIQVSNFTTPPNSPSVTSRIIREAIMTPRKPKGNQRNRDILRKPRRLQF